MNTLFDSRLPHAHIARRVTVVCGGLAVLALVLVGCGDDEPAGSPDAPLDAATPGHDASALPVTDAAPGALDAAAGDARAAVDAAPPASTSAQQLCVDTINQYRKTLNLPPLARWNAAEPCGDSQALADGKTGKAHGAFGKCAESAQNECPGWPGAPASMIAGCLKMMWAEGPGADFSTHGHYINMSSTKYTMVACGFATAPNGSTWSVQDFK